MIHRKRKIDLRMIVKVRLDWATILLSEARTPSRGAQRKCFPEGDVGCLLLRKFESHQVMNK
jgi:hypothetical protein